MAPTTPKKKSDLADRELIVGGPKILATALQRFTINELTVRGVTVRLSIIVGPLL